MWRITQRKTVVVVLQKYSSELKWSSLVLYIKLTQVGMLKLTS